MLRPTLKPPNILYDMETGTVSYSNQGRKRMNGQNAGKVNLYADRSRCILVGAELFCP